MSPNSSFAGKYFALVPNFILSTLPGNRELFTKCIFHKHLPETCIRCLKQAVPQGATSFDCPNVSYPSNVPPRTLPMTNLRTPVCDQGVYGVHVYHVGCHRLVQLVQKRQRLRPMRSVQEKQLVQQIQGMQPTRPVQPVQRIQLV